MFIGSPCTSNIRLIWNIFNRSSYTEFSMKFCKTSDYKILYLFEDKAEDDNFEVGFNSSHLSPSNLQQTNS